MKLVSQDNLFQGLPCEKMAFVDHVDPDQPVHPQSDQDLQCSQITNDWRRGKCTGRSEPIQYTEMPTCTFLLGCALLSLNSYQVVLNSLAIRQLKNIFGYECVLLIGKCVCVSVCVYEQECKVVLCSYPIIVHVFVCMYSPTTCV